MNGTTRTSAASKTYDFSKIRKEVEDFGEDEKGENLCQLRLCLDILLYYTGPLRSNADGLLAFYEEAMNLVGPSATSALLDGRGRFRKVTKVILEMFPFWFTSSATERSEYGLTLESGKRLGEISDRSFQMFQSEFAPGFVRLVLPIEFLQNGTGKFIELVQKLANPINIMCGYAGFAINIDPAYPSYIAGERVYQISRRFIGIDLGKPHMFADFMPHGIKCPNWITILGHAFVQKLGGTDKLSAMGTEGLAVHRLSHGIMLQAGDAPKLGIVNRREDMSDYKEANAILKGVRIPDEIAGEYDELGGTENTQWWLRRFDCISRR